VNFVAGYLKKDPDMPMRELQELGARQGINVYPLIKELAKKKLGMGRPKRASTRRPAVARPSSRATSERVASGVATSKDPSSLVSNFIQHMKRLEEDNHALRATLQRIAELVRR
jgi:hypothetical protein